MVHALVRQADGQMFDLLTNSSLKQGASVIITGTGARSFKSNWLGRLKLNGPTRSGPKDLDPDLIEYKWPYIMRFN
jgi:hypothetical protein